MFLDPLNFLYLDGIGILCYFAHNNSIYFYKEKSLSKNFTFMDNKVCFIKDRVIVFESPKVSTQTFIKKAFRTLTRQVDYLHLESIYSPKEFKNYYNDERLKKHDILPPNTVDYMIMLKNSIKPLHKSSVENRIIRVDWAKKLIKYYGGQETNDTETKHSENDWVIIKDLHENCESIAGGGKSNKSKLEEIQENAYDAKIPIPNNIFGVQDSIDLFISNILPKSNPEKKKIIAKLIEEFIKRVKINNGISGIDYSTDDIKKYFKDVKFNDDNITQLLECLDSTILKANWRDYCKEHNFIGLIGSLIHSKQNREFDVLKGINAEYYNSNDMPYNFLEYIDNTEAIKAGKPVLLTSIFVRINDEFVEVKIGDSSKCGAQNCYNMVNQGGKPYGVRFSKNIYFEGSLNLYNSVIEFAVNSLLYFLYSKYDFVKDGNNFKDKTAIVQRVVSVGLYHVKIEQVGKVIDGYIPYIVTEYNPNLMTLAAYIKTHIQSEESWSKESIKEFLCSIMKQIYNFQVVAYEKFNFKHNDFKINNIMVDKETLSVYIIDFELSRMNFQYVTRNYYLTQRDKDFDSEIRETYSETGYQFYLTSILKRKDYVDFDIEVFFWWMCNVFSIKEINSLKRLNEHHYKNWHNYMSLLSNIIFEITNVNQEFQKSHEPNGKSKIAIELQKNKMYLHAVNLLVFRLREFHDALIKFDCLITHTDEEYMLCDDIRYDDYSTDKKLINPVPELKPQPPSTLLINESQAGGNGKLRTHIRVFRNKNKRRSTIAIRKRKTLKRNVNKTNHKTNHKSRKTSRYH
jgi:serine/threonine protein kinase